MAKDEIVISFKNVIKRYKLYKNDKKRFMAIFSKRVPYKEKLAVNDVSFDIHRGEAVAIFGKNGAGKSTVLKMIAGVTYPTEGEIKVNGRVSALLELTSGFDPELTGRENIYLKGQLCGLNNDEIRSIEETIVEFAEVDEYIDQPVRSYSSGMKARLGFAVSVNISPEILIVDEALSVGDAAFREKCLAKVKGLIADEGVTLLFVTHSVSTAKQFCNRGIVMKKGKMVFDGDIKKAIVKYEGKKKPAAKPAAPKPAAAPAAAEAKPAAAEAKPAAETTAAPKAEEAPAAPAAPKAEKAPEETKSAAEAAVAAETPAATEAKPAAAEPAATAETPAAETPAAEKKTEEKVG